jgi:enterochelin esterase-like enzyme
VRTPVLVLLAVCAACVLGAAAYARLGRSSRATTAAVSASFRSQALGRRVPYAIYLPPGYATSKARYPVVYFLHGLPAPETAYAQLAWVSSSLAKLRRKAILVIPQGAAADAPDPEYHDWGPGKDWETAIAVELTAAVDARYRTIASRRGRAIVGLSAGGYGAAIIGLHHPAEYAVVESWSGYFRPTDPTGVTTLELGSKAADDDASVHALVSKLARQFAAHPTFLGFYVGAQDPTFVADNVKLDRELTAARVPHAFAVYRGGHTASLWQAHATHWLGLALDRLAAE